MKGHGEASFRAWPVTVTAGGKEFVIRSMPADCWIMPIISGDFLEIFPGKAELSFDGILDDLDALTGEECFLAARDAISVASGMDWCAAIQLVDAATADMGISGELILRGIDATRVSLGAYVQAVYALLIMSADSKARAKIDATLSVPPPGFVSDESGFEQLMAQRGVN